MNIWPVSLFIKNLENFNHLDNLDIKIIFMIVAQKIDQLWHFNNILTLRFQKLRWGKSALSWKKISRNIFASPKHDLFDFENGKNFSKKCFFLFSKSIFSLDIEKISLFSFDSETIVGGIQFDWKRYF